MATSFAAYDSQHLNRNVQVESAVCTLLSSAHCSLTLLTWIREDAFNWIGDELDLDRNFAATAGVNVCPEQTWSEFSTGIFGTGHGKCMRIKFTYMLSDQGRHLNLVMFNNFFHASLSPINGFYTHNCCSRKTTMYETQYPRPMSCLWCRFPLFWTM